MNRYYICYQCMTHHLTSSRILVFNQFSRPRFWWQSVGMGTRAAVSCPGSPVVCEHSTTSLQWLHARPTHATAARPCSNVQEQDKYTNMSFNQFVSIVVENCINLTVNWYITGRSGFQNVFGVDCRFKQTNCDLISECSSYKYIIMEILSIQFRFCFATS